MAIKIICECGKKFLAEGEYAGRVVTCPECDIELDLSQATMERAMPGDEWDAGDSTEDAINETDSDITSENVAEENHFEDSDLSETNVNLPESNPFDVDAQTPTMSTAERVLWSLVGVGGIALVVLSLLGKFDILGIVVSFAMAIPALIFAYRINCIAEKSRTHAFQLVAHSLGLQFAPFGNDELHGQLIVLQLDKVGQYHRLTNVMYGKIGHTQVAVFDFEYSLGKARPRQTVVRLSWRGAKLPDFSIGPRNWITKDLFESLAGRDDIHFASDSTFSDNYFLRGSNESNIRRLFTGLVRTFYAEHHGLTTEVSGNKLHYYRSCVRVPPDEVQSFLNEALELMVLLKPANAQRNS